MLMYIDYLGPEVGLTQNSSKRFQTKFGGFASMLLIFIAGIAFFGFGRDIFERKKPRVTFNRIINDETPYLLMTEKNFLFAIYDQYTDESIPDFERRFQNYFDITGMYGDGTVDRRYKIPMEKCSEEVKTYWKGYFSVDPDIYYCLPKGFELVIRGVLNEGNETSIRFQTDYCSNNTDPKQGQVQIDCIQKEDTQILLASKRIQMHYILQDSLIDTYNYTSPVIPKVVTGLVNTNAFSWTRMTILFKKVVFNSDNGFFVEDLVKSSSIAVENIQPESIYSLATNTIFSHLIGHSRWQEVYNRSYIKIQDAFAMMGGFLNISIVLLSYVVKYISRPKLVDIFNRKYKYIKIDDEKVLNGKYKKNHFSLTNNNLSKFNLKNNSTTIQSNNFLVNQIIEQDLDSKLKNKNLSNNLKIPNYIYPEEKHENNIDNNFSNNKGSKIKQGIDPENKIITTNNNNFVYELVKIKKNSNYSIPMNFLTRIFRICCRSNRNLRNLFYLHDKSNEKLDKVSGIENLFKLTRYVKLMRYLLLEEYQREVFKLCPVPQKDLKNITSFEEHCEKMTESLNQERDKVNLRFLNFLKV